MLSPKHSLIEISVKTSTKTLTDSTRKRPHYLETATRADVFFFLFANIFQRFHNFPDISSKNFHINSPVLSRYHLSTQRGDILLNKPLPSTLFTRRGKQCVKIMEKYAERERETKNTSTHLIIRPRARVRLLSHSLPPAVQMSSYKRVKLFERIRRESSFLPSFLPPYPSLSLSLSAARM